MPPDLFWHGKPTLLLSYIEAYKTRLEREEEIQANMIDYQSWLTGLYVHQAVGVVLQNSLGGKGKVKAKYIKEPISFTRHREKSEKDEEARLNQMYAGFRQLTDAMNSGLKKR